MSQLAETFMPVPDFFSMPKPTLAEQKRTAKSCASVSYGDAARAATASVTLTNGGEIVINANDAAAGHIRGLLLTHDYGDVISFRNAANGFQDVTGADLENMLKAVSVQGQKLLARKWELTAAIDAAENEAALNAIDIGGWFTQQ